MGQSPRDSVIWSLNCLLSRLWHNVVVATGRRSVVSWLLQVVNFGVPNGFRAYRFGPESR